MTGLGKHTKRLVGDETGGSEGLQLDVRGGKCRKPSIQPSPVSYSISWLCFHNCIRTDVIIWWIPEQCEFDVGQTRGYRMKIEVNVVPSVVVFFSVQKP